MNKNNVKTINSNEVSEEQKYNLMAQAYQRMAQNQQQFSDLAVKRVIEIAKDQKVDLTNAHIIGVSFSPAVAIVSALYQQTIVAAGNDGQQKQLNIPIPAECLFIDDETTWKERYKTLLNQWENDAKAAKESGKLEEAFGKEPITTKDDIIVDAESVKLELADKDGNVIDTSPKIF